MVHEDESQNEDLPPLPDPTGVTDSPPGGSDRSAEDAAAPDEDQSPSALPMPGGAGGDEGQAADADLPDSAVPDDDSHAIGPDGDDVEVVMPEQDPPADGAAVPGPDPEIAKPVDPFLGRTFGGYELVEPIGRGGMGMVYRGHQVSLDRNVAIKLLNKALVDNDEFIKRFQREARAMATIHHQNIVSVIDFGQQDGIWYMVAEFVDGTNLARMIRDKLMVPPEELVPIVVHCLSGLAHVDKTKVIHRDIKPDNILIDSDGVAKIADFGLAKDLSKDETDLTAAGSAMGTPAYMSPEQCMGHTLDGRSDLYSLGVTIYYALTGEKPFTGRSSFDIMTKQREYDPPMVHELNPRVPKEVSKLVAHMMQKAPTKRPKDAGECREAWLQVGQELGYLGSVTRSGEFLFPADAAKQASVAYPGESSPPPQPELRDISGSNIAPPPPDLGPQGDLDPPDLAPSAPEPPPVPTTSDPPTGNRKRTSSIQTRRDLKEGTGRRAITEGSVTCERCGTLNRASRKRCEKCGHSFVEEDSKANHGGVKDAEELFRGGRYLESANLYARLAEKETNRRQRSVLRTKEREARARQDENRYSDVKGKVSGLVHQGKISAALSLLEKTLGEVSATPSVVQEVETEITRLHRRRSRSKKFKIFLVVLVLLGGLAAAGWHYRERILTFVESVQSGSFSAPDVEDPPDDEVDGDGGGT